MRGPPVSDWHPRAAHAAAPAVSPAVYATGAERIRADYTVTLADPATQLFHVTAQFSNLAQPTFDFALPTWTPGWYTIENYAKNVLRLTVTDGGGRPLAHTMTRKQTWRTDTRGRDRVRVDFDYAATVLALNQAKLTPEIGFFTGTELFVEPLGHRGAPATVRFVLPAGWRMVTALAATDDSLVYAAPDYDVLVDAPTLLGHFDVTRFDVEGKPHYFVA